MNRFCDQLGAWIVVGGLALVVVGVWGFQEPVSTDVATDGQLCDDHTVAGVVMPGSGAWQPDPILAGMPRERPRPSYDLSEERVLARLNRYAVAEEPVVVAYGSGTSRKPMRMC